MQILKNKTTKARDRQQLGECGVTPAGFLIDQ